MPARRRIVRYVVVCGDGSTQTGRYAFPLRRWALPELRTRNRECVACESTGHRVAKLVEAPKGKQR